MEADPFAALRKADTGVSSSFADKHRNTGAGVACMLENPAEPGVIHLEHPKHPVEGVKERWRHETDTLVADWGVPVAWAEGVAALKVMDVPDGADALRWQQIVSDAEAFATRNHVHAIEAGWTIEDVFGFDPDDTATSYALVVGLKGRRAVVMADGAIVASDGQSRGWFYPGQAHAATPMIWTINLRRRAKIEAFA